MSGNEKDDTLSEQDNTLVEQTISRLLDFQGRELEDKDESAQSAETPDEGFDAFCRAPAKAAGLVRLKSSVEGD